MGGIAPLKKMCVCVGGGGWERWRTAWWPSTHTQTRQLYATMGNGKCVRIIIFMIYDFLYQGTVAACNNVTSLLKRKRRDVCLIMS